MLARELLPGVYWVGAVDWDRRLFDALIPLPDGTSYNAYLVRGSEKAALIDTVDPTMAQMLHEALSELGISRLDYVVMNHAEQDHSGALPGILARYPAAKVLCTPKGADLAISLLHIAPERLQPVGDGEAISLGGRTLEFIHAPWVHWPETMLTYLREDKVLFPCDLFGSHLATSGLYATDHGRVAEAAKRYYAEIMMPFARNISRHLERLAHQELRLVAPSHGPMYDDPAFILDLYREWVDGPPRNKAVVAYISMHGSTRLLTEQLVAALAARGVQVERFDLSSVDLGKFAMALVDAATLLLGTPAVLAGPHPLVAGAATLVNALRPQILFLGVYGSFGWGARLEQQVPSLLPNLRAELLPPVVIKGKPGPEELAQIDQLALEVAERHEQAKLRP